MTSARIRKKRQRRQAPSAPRMIGANDNMPSANDEAVVLRGVVLNRKQASDLAEAEALLALPALSAKQAGRLKMDELTAEIEKELGKRDRSAREAQVEGIAEARGMTLRRGTDGTITVTRDGLETLLSAGAINRAEKAVGLKYRTDFERCNNERGLTPPALDQASHSAANDSSWSKTLKDSRDRVRAVHLTIAGVDPTIRTASMPSLPAGHPVMQSVFVLEKVAGQGQNLHDLTTSGSVRARLSLALKRALKSAAVVYRSPIDTTR